MAHSLRLPAREPSASFVSTASNTRFSIKWNGSQMIQGLERNGVSADYKIAYAIGSGSHATGFLIQIAHHLFQSPLTYYAGRGWGLSPGYENKKAPSFYRPITPQCLFCHSGEARPVRGTVNTYQEPPFEAERITCQRCHGPVEAHLRNPVAGSIISPAKLPVRARDSVCEQCHLSGEAFILNPGKHFSDFHPGEDLEDVFTVYVFESSRDPEHPNALTVISQSQQLALSMCARMSGGKLWCGTCHNPHEQPAHPVAYFRARCLSCHGAALLETHPKPNRNCIACHMPRLPVTNGGHTIFTDHRIAIYTAQEIAGKATPPAASLAREQQTLVAWRPPPPAFQERNLGLADVKAGERLKAFTLVNRGFKLLLQCWSKFPNDPAVVTAIGQVLLGAGDASQAEALFQKVIQLRPNDASSYVHAALAWHAEHKDAQAVSCLNKALRIDPLVQQSYRDLAGIYAADHDLVMRRQTYERFLRAFPKSIEAQTAVQRAGRLMLLPATGGGEANPD
ncbi:MAG: hypothetical protein ACRD3O_14420 [Terriglobia bacterium]